jgi:hypothetical protein
MTLDDAVTQAVSELETIHLQRYVAAYERRVLGNNNGSCCALGYMLAEEDSPMARTRKTRGSLEGKITFSSLPAVERIQLLYEYWITYCEGIDGPLPAHINKKTMRDKIYDACLVELASRVSLPQAATL